MVNFILYSPKAASGAAAREAERLREKYESAKLVDVETVHDYAAFFDSLGENDRVILIGGDGTLHHFANAVRDIELKNEILYHPFGTGNDFAHDIGAKCGDDVEISKYLRDLPRVTVKGKTKVFVNNVGFGIDGYCTERGDELRERQEAAGRRRRVNYTLIALRGLLFAYKVRDAEVTVDGVTREFHRVWLASCTKGRYFGGGMKASPTQDRSSADGEVSTIIFHGLGKLHALILFPTMVTGRHLKYEKYIKVIKGHRVKVKFDRPTPLQTDGETVRDVTEYSIEA